MSETTNPPAISVVVVTRDDGRTLRPIVASLKQQSIAPSMELIVVAPSTEACRIEAWGPLPFTAVRVVAVGPIVNRGSAAAAGARVARGPIVALTENHCFPEADWAERTVEAHGAGWSAVGPSVLNANPETTLSHAMHTTGYGAYPADGEAGPRSELPLHNSSYDRRVLARFDAQLDHLLADERRMMAKLIEAGHELYFEPACRKRHINEATWGLVLGLGYNSGRRYGGVRSRRWSWPKRLVYASAVPVLTARIARGLVRRLPSLAGAQLRGPSMKVVAWVWAFTHALGEGVSYVIGEKDAFPFVENEEFYIRERLGRTTLTNTEIRALVDHLDDESHQVEGAGSVATGSLAAPL